jgi:phenylacetate-CoA ligase
MLKEQKYWNPVLETLPQEKLQNLQLKKFKRLFQWGYERSKFHRSLYDKAGIEPDDIRSFEDIRHVPKVEKSMMRGIQGKDPFPYGDALCVAPEEVTIPPDERNHRSAHIPGRYLARLGVVCGMLVFHPMGTGLPSQ